MSLMNTDIESELSYAYLHAVTSHAGFECALSGRHSDNAGIDARIHARGPFPGPLKDLTIEVQLKATKQVLTEQSGRLSYPLALGNYNSLRSISTQAQRILVVMQLPNDPASWLAQSQKELAIRRCAHWISLRGAPDSQNTTSHTVHLPISNLFTVDALRTIIETNSHETMLDHA